MMMHTGKSIAKDKAYFIYIYIYYIYSYITCFIFYFFKQVLQLNTALFLPFFKSLRSAGIFNVFERSLMFTKAASTLLGLRGFLSPGEVDLPWHLCFFQLLIHCIQHKLGCNNVSIMHAHVCNWENNVVSNAHQGCIYLVKYSKNCNIVKYYHLK